MGAAWFDPLGLRRIVDAMATVAASTLVGRRVEIDGGRIRGRVAAVREAAPSAGIDAALSGHVGLWRRLDVDFDDVQVDGRRLDRVSIAADDVRVLDTLPQRVGAKHVEFSAAVGASHVDAWIDHIASGHGVAIDGDQMVARLPGFGSWGLVELDPWVDGRNVGVDVDRARVKGRAVRLPERIRRRYQIEVDFLPVGTALGSVHVRSGGLEVAGSIERYGIEVDVPRLLADLGAQQADAVISVLLGD